MKRRILVLVAAVCVAMGMEAQFFPGFNPQQAKLKAQEEAEKAYQKGNDFLRAKKYDRAFDLYQKAADAGHAGAQYNLATFYIEGKVVLQDYEKAVYWFEKAAIQGVKDAQYNLAAIYHQGAGVPKDEERAQYWARVYKDIEKLEVKKEELQPNFPFPPRPQEPVEEVPDEQAEFEGGQQALMTWLSQNMQYPAKAVEDDAQGRVLVGFIVNRDGSVDDVKVVKSVHPALDEEAVRVVKAMPKWKPGKKGGKTVRVRYTLPMTFKMQEAPKTEGSESGAAAQ